MLILFVNKFSLQLKDNCKKKICYNDNRAKDICHDKWSEKVYPKLWR